MQLSLRYLGHSGVSPAGEGLAVSFAPNLSRPKVFFDADVVHPLRYREAMSALHAVVVSDLRFKKRSGSEAYQAFKKAQAEEDERVRRAAYEAARTTALAQTPDAPPADLEGRFKKMHAKYWTARRAWARFLADNDPELFRHLVPCDPVVTVAPDVVLFEGFAKDESSYGCLVVDRGAFRGDSAKGLGTTNVDYSNALYRQLQTLRTYRSTRLVVDPSGFEVNVAGAGELREEKIDLPPTWLRGFGQISAATTLPARVVRLDVGTVYAIVAYLVRHRERSGPRSLRFELVPGRPPVLHLDPFGLSVTSSGPSYDGPVSEVIKIWGRRRLVSLARLLPLVEHVDVHLLGSGLPSVWVSHLGEMDFVLGLSGWTTSSLSAGAGLDLLGGATDPDPALARRLDALLLERRRMTLAELVAASGGHPEAKVGAALTLLAKQGQLIFDFAHRVYRHRPVMPLALSEATLGPEPEELVGARAIVRAGQVELTRDEVIGGLRILTARAGGETIELALDPDGLPKQGRCGCSWHFRFKLRQGPCRHLLATRMFATRAEAGSS